MQRALIDATIGLKYDNEDADLQSRVSRLRATIARKSEIGYEEIDDSTKTMTRELQTQHTAFLTALEDRWREENSSEDET